MQHHYLTFTVSDIMISRFLTSRDPVGVKQNIVFKFWDEQLTINDIIDFNETIKFIMSYEGVLKTLCKGCLEENAYFNVQNVAEGLESLMQVLLMLLFFFVCFICIF